MTMISTNNRFSLDNANTETVKKDSDKLASRKVKDIVSPRD